MHRDAPRTRSPFIVGYLSVINRGKGLHLLIEGFARFLQETKSDARLQIAGRVLDPGYWRAIRHSIRLKGLQERITFYNEVNYDGKREFLHRCSVLVMPSQLAETRAMVALEAQAAAVPVIAPERGVFSEIFALTHGGVLVPPDTPSSIATALVDMYRDPDNADRIGKQGAAGVAEYFSVERMAEQMHEAIMEITVQR
jgi:glycosyltransferase involved in cell wall biosynthesis